MNDADSPAAPTTAPTSPSIWPTVLVVWGTYEGSNALSLLSRAARDQWPSALLNPLSLDMWQSVVGGTLRTLSGAPGSIWLVSVVFLIAPVAMTLLSIVAVWKSRRDLAVVGSVALMILADLFELENTGSSGRMWQMEWLMIVVGSSCLVIRGWRYVPPSSWFVITLLSVSILVQRWWPLLLFVVLAQVSWALVAAKSASRPGMGAMWRAGMQNSRLQLTRAAMANGRRGPRS